MACGGDGTGRVIAYGEAPAGLPDNMEKQAKLVFWSPVFIFLPLSICLVALCLKPAPKIQPESTQLYFQEHFCP